MGEGVWWIHSHTHYQTKVLKKLYSICTMLEAFSFDHIKLSIDVQLWELKQW
jgi:hypothetical protein